jgi:16S rRNA C1402 (ribose-2'-O) methylase RsmI
MYRDLHDGAARSLLSNPCPEDVVEGRRDIEKTVQNILTPSSKRLQSIIEAEEIHLMSTFKELTKLYEEVKEAELEELINELRAMDIKGEYVIIILPQNGTEDEEDWEEELFSEMDMMLQKGLSTKDIAKYISEEKGLSYRKVYKKCLERKKILYGG